jgi:hypothetical protein
MADVMGDVPLAIDAVQHEAHAVGEHVPTSSIIRGVENKVPIRLARFCPYP